MNALDPLIRCNVCGEAHSQVNGCGGSVRYLPPGTAIPGGGGEHHGGETMTALAAPEREGGMSVLYVKCTVCGDSKVNPTGVAVSHKSGAYFGYFCTNCMKHFIYKASP